MIEIAPYGHWRRYDPAAPFFAFTVRMDALPGKVEVAVRLIRRIPTGFGRRANEFTSYEPRAIDLYPGSTGRNVQERALEAYLFRPGHSITKRWDLVRPKYDFALYDRIAYTIRARAADGTRAERTFVAERVRAGVAV